MATSTSSTAAAPTTEVAKRRRFIVLVAALTGAVFLLIGVCGGGVNLAAQATAPAATQAALAAPTPVATGNNTETVNQYAVAAPTTGQTQQASGIPDSVATTLAKTIGDAQQYYAQNHTYAGFTPASTGVLYGAGTDTSGPVFVAAMIQNNGCYKAAVRNGTEYSNVAPTTMNDCDSLNVQQNYNG